MKKRCYIFGMFACLLSISLVTGGCEPLRKKFTRQKKKDQSSEVIPILEPIDYPDKIHIPAEEYKQRYSLWQVWFREFLNSLEEASSAKQELYNLTQVITHLQGMQKLLVAEKNAKLSTLIEQFESLKEIVQKPDPFQNTTNIKLKAELLGKQIREDYKLNKVKDSLVEKVENSSIDEL